MPLYKLKVEAVYHFIGRVVAHVRKRFARRTASCAATIIAVGIGSTYLAGCAVGQASDTSFANEFIGTFSITDSSNDPAAQGKTVKIAAVRANLLILSIGSGPELDLFNCRSRVVNQSNSLGNGEGQDSVHELICDDNEGWSWYLDHGAPGLVETPTLFNRILPRFHTVRSASGYLFHRGFPDRGPRVYALKLAN